MFHTSYKKGALLAASLGALLLLSPGASVRAGDRDDRCEDRIERTQAKLHEAIEHHGEHSRQARKYRHKLEELRERCRFDRDRYYR